MENTSSEQNIMNNILKGILADFLLSLILVVFKFYMIYDYLTVPKPHRGSYMSAPSVPDIEDLT